MLGTDFEIKFYNKDQKEINITNEMFLYLIVKEIFRENIYTLTLALRNFMGILTDTFFEQGTDLIIKIIHKESKEITIETLVFSTKYELNAVIITLVPKFYIDLVVTKHTKYYKNKFDKIILDIFGSTNLNLTSTLFSKNKEVENSNSETDIFYQNNESYYGFIIKNLGYLKNESGQSNYCFFINKMNVLRCQSMQALAGNATKSKNEVVLNQLGKTLIFEDKTFSHRCFNGMGATINYFDWANYEMKTKSFHVNSTSIQQQLLNSGNKFYNVDEINSYVYQSNPIGNDYFTKDNCNLSHLNYTVNCKNYFNLFIDFVIGADISLSPMDFIKLDLNDDNESYRLNGYWMVYNIRHIFSGTNGYSAMVTCTNMIYNYEK